MGTKIIYFLPELNDSKKQNIILMEIFFINIAGTERKFCDFFQQNGLKRATEYLELCNSPLARDEKNIFLIFILKK